MSIAVRDVAKIQSFTLSFGEKKYGIDVLKVGEISGMTDIPPLPGAHLLVGGTVDLKEKTATAADLHLEFQAEGHSRNASTSVFSLRLNTLKGTIEVGVIIDKIGKATFVGPPDIEPSPQMRSQSKKSCFAGTTERKEDADILLGINRILSEEKQRSASAEKTTTEEWRRTHE